MQTSSPRESVTADTQFFSTTQKKMFQACHSNFKIQNCPEQSKQKRKNHTFLNANIITERIRDRGYSIFLHNTEKNVSSLSFQFQNSKLSGTIQTKKKEPHFFECKHHHRENQ